MEEKLRRMLAKMLATNGKNISKLIRGSLFVAKFPKKI